MYLEPKRLYKFKCFWCNSWGYIFPVEGKHYIFYVEKDECKKDADWEIEKYRNVLNKIERRKGDYYWLSYVLSNEDIKCIEIKIVNYPWMNPS